MMLISFFTWDNRFIPNANVRMVGKEEITMFDTCISSVEYNDGSFIDIYYINGELVGVRSEGDE